MLCLSNLLKNAWALKHIFFNFWWTLGLVCKFLYFQQENLFYSNFSKIGQKYIFVYSFWWSENIVWVKGSAYWSRCKSVGSRIQFFGFLVKAAIFFTKTLIKSLVQIDFTAKLISLSYKWEDHYKRKKVVQSLR